MEIRSFFTCLIWIFLCVFRNEGQEISVKNTSNMSIGKVEFQREPRLPPGLMYNMYRTPSRIPRVVGGRIAYPHTYPFQVALQVKKSGILFSCGGTLLNIGWVLTAAHCIDKADYTLVVLGAHDIGVAEIGMKIMNATTFIKHKKYSLDTLLHDIGLIKLPYKATLNKNIQTVQLVTVGRDFVGQTARCLGWGRTILGTTSRLLRYVDLDVITNDQCKSFVHFSSYIAHTSLCTTGEGFVGSCQGDSGGPLLLEGKQIGIVSFGGAKCDIQDPSTFTKVPEYIDWIIDNTGMEFKKSAGRWYTMESLIKACIGIMVLSYIVL